MVHERVALDGRADEGSRHDDPKALRVHPRLGKDPQTQSPPRSHQQPVPSRQTRGAPLRRFRAICSIMLLVAGALDFSKLNPYVAQPT